jgi:hypothetical protein
MRSEKKEVSQRFAEGEECMNEIVLSRCTVLCCLCLVAAVAVLSAGCEDRNIGHISGKVTLNGKPLTKGSVVFEDKAADISIYAPLTAEGTYKIRTHDKGGLPAGTYRVAITPLGPFSGTPVMTNPGKKPPGSEQPIPEKYQNAATSGLTATVQAGENPPFDFDLAQ